MKLPESQMTNDFSSDVHFLPWVGKNYENNGILGKRLLILGESHYTKKFIDSPREITKYHTRHVIQVWALDRTARFYTITRKLILKSLENDSISSKINMNKSQFWDSVSFYNYVQSFVGNKARVRPNSAQWENAKNPLGDVLKKLHPDFCVVLGKQLWSEVSKNLSKSVDSDFKYFEVDGKKIYFIHTAHPSSGISYKKYIPQVKKLLCG